MVSQKTEIKTITLTQSSTPTVPCIQSPTPHPETFISYLFTLALTPTKWVIFFTKVCFSLLCNAQNNKVNAELKIASFSRAGHSQVPACSSSMEEMLEAKEFRTN